MIETKNFTIIELSRYENLLQIFIFVAGYAFITLSIIRITQNEN